ncbi:MAG: hypothetical protein KAV99_03710 [Candidatus Latescibacteria bacterium]|nr:hypothetical protein [Candidatus Latescibacterota bacterium]
MRKLMALLALSCCFFAMVNPAYALFRLGVHGGKDLYSIEQESRMFSLKDKSVASLTREEIAEPILFGGDIYLDIIPFVDLELGLEAAVTKYDFTYIVAADTTSEEAAFGRIALYATLKRNIIQFPPVIQVVSVYIGGGTGLYLVSPVICEDLVYDELETGEEELEVSQLIGKAVRAGAHAVVGIKLTPPGAPLALDLKAKYVMLGKGSYKEPERFFALSVGLAFGF